MLLLLLWRRAVMAGMARAGAGGAGAGGAGAARGGCCRMCGAPRRAHVILSRPQQQKTKQQQVRQDALLFRTAPRRLLRHHLPRLRPDDGDDGLPPPNHSRQDTNATPRPDTGTQRARCSQQRTPAKGARQPLEGNKHAPSASAAAAASAEDPSTAALLADQMTEAVQQALKQQGLV